MVYMISPIRLTELLKYKIPMDKYGNILLNDFYNTEDGFRFFNLSPCIIYRVKNKKDCLSNFLIDIQFLSLCYNIPLYIYFSSDNWWYKNTNLHFTSHRNFGICSKMQEADILGDNPSRYLLPKNSQRYFSGNQVEIETTLNKVFDSLNLRENKVNEYLLSVDSRLKKLN